MSGVNASASVPSLWSHCTLRAPRPVVVHFLGAPGVGKSSLIRATLSECGRGGPSASKGLCWIGFQEARQLAIRNFSRELCAAHGAPNGVFQRGRVLVRALAAPLKRALGEDPVREALKRFERDAVSQFLGAHDAVFRALAEYWFDPEITPPPLPVRYWQLAQHVAEWLLVVAYAGSCGVLGDNTRLTKGCAELLANASFVRVEENVARLRRLCLSELFPRAVVYLEASPEVVLHRIHGRAVEGGMHQAHRGRSDDEIVAYTRRRTEAARQAIRCFSSWGIPVITLDAASPIAANVRLVGSLLRELCP